MVCFLAFVQILEAMRAHSLSVTPVLFFICRSFAKLHVYLERLLRSRILVACLEGR